jgi:hypothetical protein
MNTQNTPKIEQWMRDAADEYHKLVYSKSALTLTAIIAKHAPQSPAELPSIWKPVSQRPTKEDGDESMCVVMYGSGMVWDTHWSRAGSWPEAHWCRTADLLERCPLPKVKTQAELDEEIADSLASEYAFKGIRFDRGSFLLGMGHGRATAKTEGER